VWTVKDNQAQPQPIRTGRRDGDRVEVLSGLEPGQWILTNGSEGRQGMVRVVRDEPRPSDRAALLGQ
jgi:multidrug efflux pump subunit AcrA (membrane-fusion protein)